MIGRNTRDTAKDIPMDNGWNAGCLPFSELLCRRPRQRVFIVADMDLVKNTGKKAEGRQRRDGEWSSGRPAGIEYVRTHSSGCRNTFALERNPAAAVVYWGLVRSTGRQTTGNEDTGALL